MKKKVWLWCVLLLSLTVLLTACHIEISFDEDEDVSREQSGSVSGQTSSELPPEDDPENDPGDDPEEGDGWETVDMGEISENLGNRIRYLVSQHEAVFSNEEFRNPDELSREAMLNSYLVSITGLDDFASAEQRIGIDKIREFAGRDYYPADKMTLTDEDNPDDIWSCDKDAGYYVTESYAMRYPTSSSDVVIESVKKSGETRMNVQVRIITDEAEETMIYGLIMDRADWKLWFVKSAD